MVDRALIFEFKESDIIKLSEDKEVLAVVLEPRMLGAYRLIGMVDVQHLRKGRNSVLKILFLSIVLGFALIASSALLLSRKLVERVCSLKSFVSLLGKGDYKVRVKDDSVDELGQLASTFNEMAGGLEIRERLKHFVSATVWEEVKKEDELSLSLGGERKEVVVLLSHIRNFEKLVHDHQPELLIEFLNDYFTRMDTTIKEHHGAIDKLIEDCVMAVFHHIAGQEHPAIRAISAAKKMFQEQSTMNKERARKEVS